LETFARYACLFHRGEMELVLPLVVLRGFITSRERVIGVEGTSLFGYRVVLLVYVCIVLSSSVQKCSSILILSKCLQCKQGLDIECFMSQCVKKLNFMTWNCVQTNCPSQFFMKLICTVVSNCQSLQCVDHRHLNESNQSGGL
jgi:hypothetical protein